MLIANTEQKPVAEGLGDGHREGEEEMKWSTYTLMEGRKEIIVEKLVNQKRASKRKGNGLKPTGN